ncbi:MAG: hypothetical protein AB7S38_35825 [Vulcanimicrobiota bacterium]
MSTPTHPNQRSWAISPSWSSEETESLGSDLTNVFQNGNVHCDPDDDTYAFLNFFQSPDACVFDTQDWVMSQATQAQLVGDYNPYAMVAVLDDFEGSNHGRVVETILSSFSGLGRGFARFQNTPRMDPLARQLVSASPEHFGQTLYAYVEKFPAAGLAMTNTHLELLTSDRYPHLRAINQSQAVSPLQATMSLLELSGVDVMVNKPVVRTTFGLQLGLHLGLGATANVVEFIEAVAEHVWSLQHQSDLVKWHRDRHYVLSEKAFEQDIGYFIAAGNGGHQLQALLRLGVKLPEEFHLSWFCNDYNLMVGASEHSSGNSVEPAYFSSPGADLAVNGMRVLHAGLDGTSYAAPQVSALYVRLRIMRPELEIDEIYDLLAEACTPMESDDSLLGAGILNSGAVLERAWRI